MSEIVPKLSPLTITWIGLLSTTVGAILAGASFIGGLFLGVVATTVVRILIFMRSWRGNRKGSTE